MIVFKTLRFKNFLSYGNAWTEINFTDNSNPLTLIVGKNGSGKSGPFLDAIVFSLFGKPFRKINMSQLINSVNGCDCCTEIVFTIGKNKYKVIRGMKPDIFEIWINDKKKDQEASKRDYQKFLESNILRANRKAFCQVVILGSALFQPFMSLSVSDRREVIEDVLDIQIFSRMNKVTKQRLSILSKNVSAAETECAILEEKIKLNRRYIEDQRKEQKEKIKRNNQRILEVETEIADAKASMGTLKEKITEQKKLLKAKKKLDKKRSEMLYYKRRIEEKRAVAGETIKFFETSNVCQQCNQTISQEKREEEIHKSMQIQEECEKGLIRIADDIRQADDKEKEFEKVQEKVDELSHEYINLESSCEHHTSLIKTLQDEIRRMQQKATMMEDLEDLEKKKKNVEAELKKDREDVAVLTEVEGILNDGGVKKSIIRQYIPIINERVNKYLTEMGFFVNFHLDEQFAETIKSRYRDEFSYESFSEGEKQRIDLALLFTWRDVARMKNSVSTNLLIMDEVFDSSLDAQGTDDFFLMLKKLSGENKVFVISQRSDALEDKFDQVITAEKVKGFSRLSYG